MVTIVPTDGQAYRVTEATAQKLLQAGLIVKTGPSTAEIRAKG
jgi:hypothetical protein